MPTQRNRRRQPQPSPYATLASRNFWDRDLAMARDEGAPVARAYSERLNYISEPEDRRSFTINHQKVEVYLRVNDRKLLFMVATPRHTHRKSVIALVNQNYYNTRDQITRAISFLRQSQDTQITLGLQWSEREGEQIIKEEKR